MFDRAIAIAGVAISLIFGLWSLAPEGWPKVSPLVITVGVALGIFLIGIAIGLMVAHRPKDLESVPKQIVTNLYLRFNEVRVIPIEQGKSNIRHWFALYTESINISTVDPFGRQFGGLSVPPRWAVFVIFDKKVEFRQLIASCRGQNPPKCDIQASHPEFAIVTITGNVEHVTLDIACSL